MKISLTLLGLVTAAACAAVPAELLGRNDNDVPDVEYIFSGPLEKGGPVVDYTGASVEEIEAQVQKEHPGLSIYTAPYVDDGHSKTEDGPSAHVERQLSKRYQPWSTCITHFGFGDGPQMNSLVNRLNGMTNNDFLVQPRRCVSLGCYKSAGAGLCNDQWNIALRFSGRWTAPHISHVATRDCIWPSKMCGGKGRTPYHLCAVAVAGQRFFNDNKNNVIAGACGAFPNEWSVNGV